MTDAEYYELLLHIATKKLTLKEWEDVDSCLEQQLYAEHEYRELIEWFRSKPNIDPKPMRKMTPEDYRRMSLG